MGRPAPMFRLTPSQTLSTGSLGKSASHTCSLTEEDADWIVKRTENRVSQVIAKSTFVRENCKLDEIPRFSHEDLNIGGIIASGGFSNVHSVDSFNVKSHPLDETRKFVVKHLNPKLAMEPKKLAVGAKDLSMEAHFLASLNHDNIIKIRGLSAEGVSGYAVHGEADGFFLVFDRLSATLSNRLSTWRSVESRPQKQAFFQLTRKPAPKNSITFKERIKAAYDIANALTYLHDQGILYRDLKPANVGFDEAGTLQLFDFGLAVELPASPDPNQLYNLAGNTGTARYMAVEIIRNQPYNFKADVFSFAVLLWEIVALKKPHADMAGPEVKEWVSLFGNRPSVSKSWPTQIRKMMKLGWGEDISARPTMKQIRDDLAEVMNGLK